MNFEIAEVVDDQGAVDARMFRLRQLSNVIQALENLKAQVDGLPGFSEIRTQTQEQLVFAWSVLRREIHT